MKSLFEKYFTYFLLIFQDEEDEEEDDGDSEYGSAEHSNSSDPDNDDPRDVIFCKYYRL